MLKKKCSLCGGPLEGGRCTLCGLDNSVSERETAALRAAAAASRQERSSSRQPDSRTVAAMPEQILFIDDLLLSNVAEGEE